ncbi:MAG: NifB/NifX family molybdenum-iron cluster-binding protein [Anaerolineales bacterium]|nr:NifB/NifX family molybdenum-iron cluster-binding protein [Chloroflexota bacterium]MBL6982455.1 NifB/NifX family molybdenum-iron cluster-binding protein [Anaerolineales bacterium]
MRIAISSNDNIGLESKVSHHFGRCPYFVLVDVNNGNSQEFQVIENPFFQQHTPGQVPQFINQQHADVMICGGMGRRAIAFFEAFGIATATGADGTVATTLERYLKGELPEAQPCSHSEHGEHGHGDHHHGHHGHHNH